MTHVVFAGHVDGVLVVIAVIRRRGVGGGVRRGGGTRLRRGRPCTTPTPLPLPLVLGGGGGAGFRFGRGGGRGYGLGVLDSVDELVPRVEPQPVQMVKDVLVVGAELVRIPRRQALQHPPLTVLGEREREGVVVRWH